MTRIGAMFLVFGLIAGVAHADEQLNEYGETEAQAKALAELVKHQHKDYLPTVLICPAGMEFWECQPVKGYSRTVVKLAKVATPFECQMNAQEEVAKTGMFQNLAPGEFIKVMCPHVKGETVDETGDGDL